MTRTWPDIALVTDNPSPIVPMPFTMAERKTRKPFLETLRHEH